MTKLSDWFGPGPPAECAYHIGDRCTNHPVLVAVLFVAMPILGIAIVRWLDRRG